MSRTMESIATINSVIRTALAVIIVGGVGYGGFRGYSAYNEGRKAAETARRELSELNGALEATNGELRRTQSQLDAKIVETARMGEQLAEQAAQIALQTAQIEKLDVALRLLKVDHRVARLSVVKQDVDPDSKMMFTVVEFVELNQQGGPLEQPKRFTIKGDLVYIDNLVVKFEDQYVEDADLDRSTSLVMFRRLFGEYQEPQQGFALESVGLRPKVYAGTGEPTELENKIWSDFWAIANDTTKAKELGIRAAHGEAVSVRVRPGKSYRIVLRASDGLSIQLDDEPSLSRQAG